MLCWECSLITFMIEQHLLAVTSVVLSPCHFQPSPFAEGRVLESVSGDAYRSSGLPRPERPWGQRVEEGARHDPDRQLPQLKESRPTTFFAQLRRKSGPEAGRVRARAGHRRVAFRSRCRHFWARFVGCLSSKVFRHPPDDFRGHEASVCWDRGPISGRFEPKKSGRTRQRFVSWP